MTDAVTVKKEKLFSNSALLKLIIPLVIEQFLAIAIGFFDTTMVSSLGEAPMSGVALVDSISVLLIQIFTALATGGAVIVSQYLGKRDTPNASKASKQLVYVMTVASVLLAIPAAVFRAPIISFVFGTIEADVMQAANTYLLISAISYPFLSVFSAGAAIYRSVGNSKASMFVSIIMNVLNIAGNAIGIYVLKWGVAGAAISTLISRITGAVIIMIMLGNRSQAIYIDKLFKFEYHGGTVKRILLIGLPSSFENGAFQAGKLMLASLVSTFGTSAIAANTAAGAICSFSNLPGAAIGLALITVVGRCIGADDNEQAKYYTKKLILLTIVSMNFFNVLIVLFARPLLGMYNITPDAYNQACMVLYTFALASAVLWPIAFTVPNALRAAGDVRFTMLVSVISMGAFRVASAFVIAGITGLGMLSVWAAMYIDWVARAAAFAIRWISGKWQGKKAV